MSDIEDGITSGVPPHSHHDAGAAAEHHHEPAPVSQPTPLLSRRRALQVLGALPLAGALGFAQQQTPPQAPRQPHATPNQPATGTGQPPRAQPKRRFFTARELRLVRVLADDVIPRDARSGSATDAGVPEFMDYHLSVPETSDDTRVAWRGGMRWLDTESRRRFGVGYASAKAAQRHQILDDISYPDRATAAMRPGVAFFNRFRDLCGAGFFSSAMGWKDLQYMGHTFVRQWDGCPEPALRKLGVSYALMTTRTDANTK